MFATDFDIRNIWIMIFIIIIGVLIFYIFMSYKLRRKLRIRLHSDYSQTDPVHIVEYDVYGQPYINGYQAVLYSHV
jgi:hypothetical protein